MSSQPFPDKLDQLAREALAARPAVVPDLGGTAPYLLLARMLQHIQRPILLLTTDRAGAKQAVEALQLFLGDEDGDEDLVLEFPEYDVSPYESISPAGYTVASRIHALFRLGRIGPPPIVVAAAGAVALRVMPPVQLSSRITDLAVGAEWDRDRLVDFLVQAGFVRTPLVEDTGDMSARGDIVDIFLPQLQKPVRIEFDMDRIGSIRSFDPHSQRTRSYLEKVSVIPFREISLTEHAKQLFGRKAKALADELNIGKIARDKLVQSIDAGIFFPGIEFYSSLLFDEPLASILDYLPNGSLVAVIEPLHTAKALDKASEIISERWEEQVAHQRIVPRPEDIGIDGSGIMQQLAETRPLYFGPMDPTDADRARLRTFPWEARSNADLRDLIVAQPADKMLQPVVQRIEKAAAAGAKPLAVAHTSEQAERLHRLLSQYGVRCDIDESQTVIEAARAGAHDPRTLTIVSGELTAGFDWPDAGLFLLAEEEVFGPRRRRPRTMRQEVESAALADFDQIGQGDYLVHVHHGIARYAGLNRIEAGGVQTECLLLEYAKGDRLYVPVDRLGLVQRYIGGEGHPALDRLGGQRWDNARKRARKAVRRMAKELLALYAARRARPGHAFDEPDAAYDSFAATFPYEETPDQERSIDDVLDDLQQERPMDRLVCGDVGFGKTEVALRAAFLVAMGGKQVAVLVPTTTLAYQHFRTFSERMKKFPLNVRMLSRFVEPEKRKAVIEGLADGSVDVAVGTHQLLAKRVGFRDLGLLIVDEEQHFGVAQKERIKHLKNLVDVLTMTATPIPRTFHMSLTGLVDLSTINTPPQDRLSIKTFVARFDEDVIRLALNRELERGGQVFVLHNRIRTIDSLAARIQRLVPEARLAVGHGQMPKGELERVMIDFAGQKIDILVCTAIIEAGIDFPNANTIIIDRADSFGLAQLYQLRGRVGRGKRRAFCYALIPPEAGITADAKKRLAVLKRFTKLGSGFRIAQHDLEIRGAGNLLGSEQSGYMAAVGFEMYAQMLDRAVKELRGQTVVDKFEPEINLPIEAWIPEEYVPDQATRLALYKRIAACSDDSDIEDISEEMQDRFGDIPEQVRNLHKVVELKLRLARMRISKLDYGQGILAFAFDESTDLKPAALVEFVNRDKRTRRLAPDGKLLVHTGPLKPGSIVERIKKLLRTIA